MLDRVLVPEGAFLMGSAGRFDNEEPQHNVFVAAVEMATTPVTNADYRAYLKETALDPALEIVAPAWLDEPGFDHPDQPVVGVNWHEALAYCDWLAERSGLAIRLPTEAEREKASRGVVEDQLYPWGNTIEGGGHTCLEGPLEAPERVATTPPNGYGLYNVADTVHEWCLDAYHSDFYQVSPSANPCAFGGARRAARGGSWRHQIVVTPCAARASLPPHFHYADFGFRWVRDLT